MAALKIEREPETDRFLVLRRWLASLGVCWKCQSTLAFVQVERERGTKDVKAVLECHTADRCRERANTGRKTMPTRTNCVDNVSSVSKIAG